MNKNCLLPGIFGIWAGLLNAQEPPLTLQDAISQARENSLSYSRAINQAENRYWNYRQFRASTLPQLTLSGTLPNYSSAIERITLDDGTYAFREREQLFLSSDLTVNQNVPFTGGNLAVSSGLQRTDIYSPRREISYFSTPVSVSYSQPMLLYNSLKWNRKIEPLRYREARKKYDEDLEQIGFETTKYYFDALAADIARQIAEGNVENNDTIFKISQGRYNLGKIAENDLLQIELNLLNAENALTNARLDYQVATQDLKRFLGIPTDQELALHIPKEIPEIKVSVSEALAKARKNRAAVLEFRRKRLEAEEAVAQARGQTNYNFNLSANFGLSRQAQEFQTAYTSPLLEQQNIVLGLSIPIIDWGRAKARVKKAKANRRLVETNMKQEQINFEQEIFLQVMQFNAQYQQLAIAAKADTVAQKRYKVAKARYLTGKISITDFNLAQSEKDQARQAYIQSLRSFWQAYFTLRRLTLYDFVNDKPIDYEADF